jgi:hypothetical protein
MTPFWCPADSANAECWHAAGVSTLGSPERPISVFALECRPRVSICPQRCGPKDADSTGFNEETPFPVIFKLRDLVNVEELGGTMRLGEWACKLTDGSLARDVYRGRGDR